MKLHDPSRRQLLGSFLAGLLAWLWPRRQQLAAAVPPAAPLSTRPPRDLTRVITYAYDVEDNPVRVWTYVYDAHGRLTKVSP